MPNKSIVLIDDDQEYTNLIEAWLKNSDFDCIVTNSSTAAFMTIEKAKPDLILLDLNMPNLNGHEVCAVLKTHEDFKKIPVVFLSASTDQEVKDRAFALGAQGYLSKLTEKENFLASLKEYL